MSTWKVTSPRFFSHGERLFMLSNDTLEPAAVKHHITTRWHRNTPRAETQLCLCSHSRGKTQGCRHASIRLISFMFSFSGAKERWFPKLGADQCCCGAQQNQPSYPLHPASARWQEEEGNLSPTDLNSTQFVSSHLPFFYPKSSFPDRTGDGAENEETVERVISSGQMN